MVKVIPNSRAGESESDKSQTGSGTLELFEKKGLQCNLRMKVIIKSPYKFLNFSVHASEPTGSETLEMLVKKERITIEFYEENYINSLIFNSCFLKKNTLPYTSSISSRIILYL